MITHGKPPTIGPALDRLEKVAHEAGVELLLPDEEVEKHGVGEPEQDLSGADIAVVLGGDGTMLRALQRFLGSDIPVIGVNFGRVGFLASIQPNELESGLARVFSGDYRVVQLTTLEVDTQGTRGAAVNDVVVLSGIKGRMVELSWALSPVLVRGLDAMAVTFIAPHSLHARPMVVPRGLDLEIRNRTPDVPASVLVDGHALAEVSVGEEPITIRLGDQRTLLATLPEATFFRRYRETFGS